MTCIHCGQPRISDTEIKPMIRKIKGQIKSTMSTDKNFLFHYKWHEGTQYGD
jgi:hypothetical protein